MQSLPIRSQIGSQCWIQEEEEVHPQIDILYGGGGGGEVHDSWLTLGTASQINSLGQFLFPADSCSVFGDIKFCYFIVSLMMTALDKSPGSAEDCASDFPPIFRWRMTQQ